MIEDTVAQESRSAMQEVTSLAEALCLKAQEIKDKEDELDILLDDYNKLELAFADMGFDSLGLPSGQKVQVDTRVSTAIISQNNFQKYAASNDLLYKLKDTLEITFAGENRNLLSEIMDKLNKSDVAFDFKQSVHHSTLNSYIKKVFDNASDKSAIIQELAKHGLKVGQYKQVKIKSASNNTLLYKRRFKK